MKILVACEESQAVCKAFREKGHEAYSCDIEPCSGGHPEWHIMEDSIPLINGKCKFKTMDGIEHEIDQEWDVILAFPPCTHLAVSGAKHFEKKRNDGRQKEAVNFFYKFVNADCEKICIENPVGIISGNYVKKWFGISPLKADQIIEPYEFGDPFEKKTCLWLKNLTPLKPSNIVVPEKRQFLKSGKSLPAWYSKGYGAKRQKMRSKTFPGIAKAMADQWG